MSVRADKHQRILADLLTKPGNDVCADCRERAPRWSAWNLGIFICVHCASIHRKMGTHISKVKSVTLDTWTKDQVESVKNMGNLKANAIYNPDQRRHPPPTDYDESDRDSEMEKYIRNKYQYKRFLAPPEKEAPAAPVPTTTITPHFAPVRSPSPPYQQQVPRVPAKDPVPGRVGGSSLGEASEFDKVIRAPSRAKSTPIVANHGPVDGRSSAHLPSQSPAIPSIPSASTSRAPVFQPKLPYRPSTAAALEAPYASAASSSSSAWPSSSYRTNNTSSAPPVPPVTYPMRPYSAASTVNSVGSAPSNQPPLQYLAPSTSANPTWDDIFSLPTSSGTPQGNSGIGQPTLGMSSQLGASAFQMSNTPTGNPSLGGLARPTLGTFQSSMSAQSQYGSSSLLPNNTGIAARSFSLPLGQQSLSPVVTGASNYSTGSTSSSGGGGAPNPFFGLNANSSALSLGAGSTGTGASAGGLSGSSSLNPYSNLASLSTSNTGYSSNTTPSSGLSDNNAWSSLSAGGGMVSSPTAEQQLAQSFGSMNLGAGGLNNGSTLGTRSGLGMTSTGVSGYQMSQPTGSSLASTQSSLSFQQAYNLNPYSNMSTPTVQSSSLSASPLSSFQSPSPTSGNNNSGAQTQTSFAQSMLPSHLKGPGQQPQQQSNNPFGSAGQWQQQQQQQQQQAGQAAFGNLFSSAYGNGMGSNGNGWH